MRDELKVDYAKSLQMLSKIGKASLSQYMCFKGRNNSTDHALDHKHKARCNASANNSKIFQSTRKCHLSHFFRTTDRDTQYNTYNSCNANPSVGTYNIQYHAIEKYHSF